MGQVKQTKGEEIRRHPENDGGSKHLSIAAEKSRPTP
jgi:hypothetical protein